MNYYLKFDGTNDYVVSATVPTITTDFSLEFYGVLRSSGSQNRMLALTNGTEYIAIGVRGDNWKIYSHGVTPSQSGTVKYDTPIKLRVKWDGSILSLYEDDAFVYSTTPTQTAFLSTLNAVLIGAADDPVSHYSDIELYSATITAGGVTQNLYDPSASNGTGQTLIDTVGGNNGSLINFPTDDSQWVFYNDGSKVSATVAFYVPAPSFYVSASATLPQPQASIDFTIAPPIFNAAAEVTLPQPIASVDFTIAAPVFSASATATLPIIRQKPKLTIRVSSRSGSTIRAKGSTSRIRVK